VKCSRCSFDGSNPTRRGKIDRQPENGIPPHTCDLQEQGFRQHF
jgi:hypothetical protein